MNGQISQIGSAGHLEGKLILRILQCSRYRLIGRLAGSNQVLDRGTHILTGLIVIIALLNNRNIRAHLNDVSIDRLSVEEVNAFLIYIGLTG